GCSISRLVQNETYQSPQIFLIVILVILPTISCDFLNLIQPVFLGKETRSPITSQFANGSLKDCLPSNFFLNLGMSGLSSISPPSANLKKLGLRGFRLFCFKRACSFLL